jgi:hypothetical protein
MMLKIAPQEFHVLNDRFVIKTRVPVESIADADLMLRIRAANLAPGDQVTVQSFDHGYDNLLAEAEYRVTGRRDDLKLIDDVRGPRQVTETAFLIARKGEWWIAPSADAKGAEAAGLSLSHKGGGTFVVLDGEGGEQAVFTKEDGGKSAAEAFLAEAQKVAA